MADTEDDDEGGGAPAASSPTSGDSGIVPIGTTQAPAEPRAPAPAGPDFTSLVKSPGEMGPLQDQLAAIQRAKTATNAANADETAKRLEVDRTRMEQAYKASATMPEELKSGWDAKAKSAEHSTDPVTAFGSIGSVFAMLASSFAGLPMSAGLNAGAAAINAIHAGDEKAYNREYESWKANTDLAIKRHDIQRQAYNDATNLMNSNINAGRTKMELAASKFGDQKAQALLDAGMDKELFELFSSRNKAATEMQSSWDKVQLEHEKVQDLRNDPRFQDPATKATAISDWTQRWSPNGSQKLRYDFTKDYIDAQKKANPDWTPDDLAKWGKEAANAQEADDNSGMGGMKPNTPEKAFIADKAKQLQETENREPTAEERLQWKQEWTTAQTKKTSSGAQKAAAIKEIFDNAAAEGNPITMAEATKKYNLTISVPTPNRLDDINKQINMFDNGKTAIDKALAAIDKHWGTPGAAGYVTRAGERVGNIFGSNETDRVQFAHDIQYLQTIAPRLLNDASSRGLKAEADKIGSIIAGLNVGDTTANTRRALGEVRDLWDKMQQDNIARRNGTPRSPPAAGESTGSPTSGGAGGPSGSKKAPWQNDPIVKPRADAGADAAYG